MPEPAHTADIAARERLYVALDTAELERARGLARALAGAVGGLKLGQELFTAHGPAGVRAVAGEARLFLDLKFHDIPNTVAGAVRAACALGPAMLTVHAAGGPAMLAAAAGAARDGAEAAGSAPPLVLAVTVLTSLDAADLEAVGQRGPVMEQVRRLAARAQDAGLDGAVCAPGEIAALRADRGPDFRLVVPGIRPAWAEAGDQKRAATPAAALAAGADALVVGRPVTGARDPAAAARRIVAELEAAP